MNEKEEKKSKYSGIPMTEEELKEWKKAFSDIEDCINNLYNEKENF